MVGTHSLWFLQAKFGHPLEEIGLLEGWGLRAVMAEVMGPESGNIALMGENHRNHSQVSKHSGVPEWFQDLSSPQGKAGSRGPMGPSSHQVKLVLGDPESPK